MTKSDSVARDLQKGRGKLFGVGIGPGDPELVTLKTLRLIRSADVLAYPQPDNGPSLARAIVAEHIPDKGPNGPLEEYPIVIPMVTARFPAQDVYDTAAEELAEKLREGKTVVVLCEGDPFFYGSFMYLYGRMQGDFDVEVVPGVSSIMASAAITGAPLAARNDVLTVIPGPVGEETMRARLSSAEAAVIIKVGRHFGKIRSVLSEMGLMECSRYIERATMDNQRILPLSEVDEGAAPYFSMILVHKRGDAWSLDAAKG
ncbi:precorrin-2 C(20)-methyltransferase [Kiloniella sp. b19]|uniref:precorrin-2 C(20)-methyltransferase n=1 Tax=Kiloniella sp. GXU_MW_B19 TaxID=3141326 RepID=UPI0031DA2E03